MVIALKRKYLVILSLILCVSLALSSVSAAIYTFDDVIGDDDGQDDNISDIDVKKDVKKEKVSVKKESLSTYVKLDQEKIPATKASTVTATVYANFNGVNTLIKDGTVSLYINGERQQTIDLKSCGGLAKFNIPALHENKDCKIVYDGGRYKDDEFDFKLCSSSKSLIVGEDKHALPTTIKNTPDKISGVAGSMAKISAKAVFNFNAAESIATEGHIYLLKDGKTLQVADLTRNNNPSFSFKLEKNHKYSLMYDGAEDVGEMKIDLSASSKDLNVNVLGKATNKTNNKVNKTNNQTNNQSNNLTDNQINLPINQFDDSSNDDVNMKNTGYMLAILVIVIIIIVGTAVYLRKR